MIATLTLLLPAFGAGESLRAMRLIDASGHSATLPGLGECRALVLIFVAHDCPICNSYAPEIARLCHEFEPQGAAIRVVYAERGFSQADAAAHARDYGYPCPAILDEDLRLTTRIGAKVTPEAAVLSPEGKVLYLGRIDDTYPALGQKRLAPEHRDLRNALEAELAGNPVEKTFRVPIGCDIDLTPESSGER